MKILKFNEFSINEDEMALPELPPDPALADSPAAANTIKYTFVFIDADKEWAAEYPTGGGVKKYKRYEVKDSDLTEWITAAKLTEKAEEIKDGLTGKNEMSREVYYKFKQALRDESLQYKEMAELDVEYDEDLVPYTENLDCTFLKPKSDKKKNAED